MIFKLKKFIFYYFLLTIGFLSISWLIWARFVRERVIRDIPDSLFNEFRFWILLYICCIYLYIIKNLLKPKSNISFAEIVNIFFLPWKTLDHFIKYNKYIKLYYYKFMDYFITILLNISDKQKIIITFFMQIFPRMILVTFLLLDTFYFHKLELFYKIVLIGLIPLIHRYIKYSIKDLATHYLEVLENKYIYVFMLDKAYANPYIEWELTERNKYHEKDVLLIEYAQFLTDSSLNKNVYADYDFTVICKEEIYDEYKLKKYGCTDCSLTEEDKFILKKEFNAIMPKIVLFKSFSILYTDVTEITFFKWLKIIIFSLYFIAWSYILCISYYYYPNNFYGFMYFIFNYSRYLIRYTDIFNEHEEILNQNYFILKVIKYLYKNILKKLIDEI